MEVRIVGELEKRQIIPVRQRQVRGVLDAVNAAHRAGQDKAGIQLDLQTTGCALMRGSKTKAPRTASKPNINFAGELEFIKDGD